MYIAKKGFAFLRASFHYPAELWFCKDVDKLLSISSGDNKRPAEEEAALREKELKKLSFFNDAILGAVQLSQPEEVWFEGAEGEEVHSWFFPPVGFSAQENKKWPLAVFVHGGPQGNNYNTTQHNTYSLMRNL